MPVRALFTDNIYPRKTDALCDTDLSFPAEFGILAVLGEPNYEKYSWLVGLINAGESRAVQVDSKKKSADSVPYSSLHWFRFDWVLAQRPLKQLLGSPWCHFL